MSESELEITELVKQIRAWFDSPENKEFEAWADEQHKRIDRNLELVYIQPLLKDAIPR